MHSGQVRVEDKCDEVKC